MLRASERTFLIRPELVGLHGRKLRTEKIFSKYIYNGARLVLDDPKLDLDDPELDLERTELDLDDTELNPEDKELDYEETKLGLDESWFRLYLPESRWKRNAGMFNDLSWSMMNPPESSEWRV